MPAQVLGLADPVDADNAPEGTGAPGRDPCKRVLEHRRGGRLDAESPRHGQVGVRRRLATQCFLPGDEDRKSTRLNSSHVEISYAVFCVKKKINRRLDDLHPPTEKSDQDLVFLTTLH